MLRWNKIKNNMKSTLGDRIRIAREAKGLTQGELAEKVRATSHMIISGYETGRRGQKRPDSHLLIKISNVLNVSLD